MDARVFLTADEKQALATRVGEVERATGAELVVVVATASGRYDRAEMLVGAIGAALLLAAVDVAWVGQAWTGGAPLWAQALAVGGGLLVGVVGASVFPTLRRPFTSADEMDDEVERGALAAYAAAGIGETSHGAGVLLYASLHERRVQVLVDDAVARVADEGFPARVAAAFADRRAQGERAGALRAVLDEAERTLAGKLPARDAAA